MNNSVESKNTTAKKALSMIIAIAIFISMVPVEADAAFGKPLRVKKSSIKSYAVTSTYIRVKWKKAKKAKKYSVAYRLKKKGAKWKYKTVKTTKVKISGLSPDKKYQIKIRGINGWRYGKWSSKITKTTDTIKKDMLDQVNVQRKKKGLKKLKLYNYINSTALVKAKDLKKTGVFSHKSKNLGYFYNQYDKAELIYWSGGENIAMGFTNVTSVMKAWMNSKGHRENILDEDFTHLGVGKYKTYWVQHFIQNPKKAAEITCPYCSRSFSEKKAGYEGDKGGFMYDTGGKIVYVGVCPYCDKTFFKCPDCKTGVLPISFDSSGNPEYYYDCLECGYEFNKKQ